MLFRSVAVKFWEMVEHRIAPVAEALDNTFMVNLFPRASASMMEASQDVEMSLDLLQQTKAEIIALEFVKKEIEAKVKAVIGTNQGLMTEKYRVTWINVKGSTFTVTKKDSRMLRVKKKKGY